MKTPRSLRSGADTGPGKASLSGSAGARARIYLRAWMGARRSIAGIWADFGVCSQRFRKPCAARRKTL